MIKDIIENIKDYCEDLIKDKKRVMKILLIIIILLIALGFRVHKNNQEDITVNTKEIEEESNISIYVDISGAINNPGVYEVSENTRLYEVIEKAGGLKKDANIDGINRAEYVDDGQKITIPYLSSDETGTETSINNANNDASGISDTGLVNINAASKEELMEITGVGEVIAERIIEYRKSSKFKSKEDIMCVKGIGNATYEKMKDEITV